MEIFLKIDKGGGGVQTSVRDLRVFSCITQMLLTFHKYLIHHKKEVHEEVFTLFFRLVIFDFSINVL